MKKSIISSCLAISAFSGVTFCSNLIQAAPMQEVGKALIVLNREMHGSTTFWIIAGIVVIITAVVTLANKQ